MLFQALPYVLTLIAVAGVIGRSVPPAAAGRPYVKQYGAQTIWHDLSWSLAGRSARPGWRCCSASPGSWRCRPRSRRRDARSGVALLDAAYAIPLAFLLGLVAVVMARRARNNLRWLSSGSGGTGVASTAVIVGLAGASAWL